MKHIINNPITIKFINNTCIGSIKYLIFGIIFFICINCIYSSIYINVAMAEIVAGDENAVASNIQTQTQTSSDPNEPIMLTKDQLMVAREDENIMGCIDAPNTLIEYSSLACPHCAQFHENNFAQFKLLYVDTCKVKYVLRDYPTSQSSFYAALLANCSNDYFTSMDLLFKSQMNWAFSANYISILRDILKLAGIMTSDEVKVCLDNFTLSEQIKKNAYVATKVLDINFTPIYYLNNNVVNSGKLINLDILLNPGTGTQKSQEMIKEEVDRNKLIKEQEVQKIKKNEGIVEKINNKVKGTIKEVVGTVMSDHKKIISEEKKEISKIEIDVKDDVEKDIKDIESHKKKDEKK